MLTALIAIATGLAVASNYYAQPLLETIAQSFRLSVNQAGLIVTVAQLSYATGLLLLVPLAGWAVLIGVALRWLWTRFGPPALRSDMEVFAAGVIAGDALFSFYDLGDRYFTTQK